LKVVGKDQRNLGTAQHFPVTVSSGPFCEIRHY
jgi:hypothetical protein